MKLINQVNPNFCLINAYRYQVHQNIDNFEYKEARENLKELHKYIKKYKQEDFAERVFVVKALNFYYINMSTVELTVGDIRQAIIYTKKSCRTYFDKDSQAFSQWSMARLYQEIGNQSKSLNIYYELLEYYNRTKQMENELDITHNIGYILQDLELLEQCLDKYKKIGKLNKVQNCMESIEEIRNQTAIKAG